MTIPIVEHPRLAAAIENTVVWLESDDASERTRRDPYWPKWETPWWAMTVLLELGAADRIPRRAAEDLLRVTNSSVLHFFPLVESELPPGIDPYREIVCHCALGTVGQILHACGFDLDAELPWVRPWMGRYQLEDGGWNCNEEVYSRPQPHSSLVSTLPVAELVLAAWGHTPDGRAIADRAASYLLTRKLNRSSRPPHDEIRPAWWTPCFPRLYEYDVLRGLEFLASWARLRGTLLPSPAVTETVDRLDAWFSDPEARPRDPSSSATTLRPGPHGTWNKGLAAGRFELLEVCATPDVALFLLTARWTRTREALAGVIA